MRYLLIILLGCFSNAQSQTLPKGYIKTPSIYDSMRILSPWIIDPDSVKSNWIPRSDFYIDTFGVKSIYIYKGGQWIRLIDSTKVKK